jgi:putative exosortase-associated protein (TIGR04073 family)
MMRQLLCIACLLFTASLQPPTLWAEEGNYFQRSSQKFARGAVNVASSPLEILRGVEEDFETAQPVKTVFLGPLKGIFMTTGRALVGSYEMATFFIPHGPILKPDHMSSSIKEYLAEKNEVENDGP